MSKQRKNRVTDKAKQDMQEGKGYYKNINSKLAKDYMAENRAVFKRIKESPEQFPKVYGNVRKALAKRFPYMVLFVMQPVENVIIGVFHQSSNPKKWKNRADENVFNFVSLKNRKSEK